MVRIALRSWVVVVLVVVSAIVGAGCQLVVDFDRSLIGGKPPRPDAALEEDGGVDASSAADTEDGSLDASDDGDL